MKCCAIATEDHVSVSWGVDSSPETFLEEMRKWPVMPIEGGTDFHNN